MYSNNYYTMVFTNSDLSNIAVCDIIDDTCDSFEYDYAAQCAYVTYNNLETAKDVYEKIIDLIVDIETLERIYNEL